MNLRFRTAKPLKKNTFVLVSNQQQKTVTFKNRNLSYHR